MPGTVTAGGASSCAVMAGGALLRLGRNLIRRLRCVGTGLPVVTAALMASQAAARAHSSSPLRSITKRHSDQPAENVWSDVARRSGCSMKSIPLAISPAMMTSAGFTRFTTDATARPSNSPVRASPSKTTGLPASASRKMSWKSRMSMPGSRSRNAATTAWSDTTASRHPRLPQPHKGPSGSNGRWPSSPADPDVPTCSRPPRTRPQPSPRPIVITARSSTQRPAPSQCSPAASALTSFKVTVGKPVARATVELTSTWRQPRMCESTTNRPSTTWPPTPMPNPITRASAASTNSSPRRVNAWAISATMPSTPSGSRELSGRLSATMTPPAMSVTAPVSFSGPIFTPTARW